MANEGVNGAEQGGGSDAAAQRQYQELWFSLQRREWMSVVLVPADPGGSAATIGKALADVGTRLSEIPVTAISVSSMGYDSAFALADLQQHVLREGRGQVDHTPLIHVTGKVISEGAPAEGSPKDVRAVSESGSTAEALALAPTARLIIAIPSVVTEPLGLAAAHSADAAILVVEVGRTRLADARRTVELLGRDRIAGCLLVR